MIEAASADGTTIAFDRSGDGPALIMVGGAFTDRSTFAPLAELLEPHFTVVAYDRRGRCDSGDTAPYAVEREIEDIEAVIGEVGGSAFAFGHSSGAALVLEAAAHGAGLAKLALYEPPFIVDDTSPPQPGDVAARLTELVSADRRGDAVEAWFTTVLGLSPQAVAQMRNSQMWPSLEDLVHTAPYDIAIMAGTQSGNPLPTRWACVAVPTLVMDGELSPPFMRNSAQALCDLLPRARRRSFPGADHGVAPQVLAPVLATFFAS